jgi:MurNAc alpha-1-phosphate uridylyltransferase
LTRRSNQKSDYIYAGVQVFKPALAKPYKVEKFSRNKIWNESLKRKKIYGFQLLGYWMHVGDPYSLIAAEAVINQVKLNGCNEKS